MRILLVTDSLLVNSAYAQQAKLLSQCLIKAGHEVLVYGSTYYGQRLVLDGVPMVGNSSEMTYSVEVVNQHARAFNADVIFTFKDPFVYHPSGLRQLERSWVALAPVDTEPLNTAVLQSVNFATAVIAIAKNGQQALAQEGVKAYYCPLGIDTAIFTPRDKAEARKQLNLPQDKFIALFVGANQSNPSRKNIDQLILAFNAFHASHPDSLLFLHTDLTKQLGGINLELLIHSLEWNERHYRHSQQHEYETQQFAPSFMALLYNAADVTIIPSAGEGCCLPLLESQACGTPVITTEFTAMKEHSWSGWTIPTSQEVMPYHGELIWSELGAFRFRVSQRAIYRALEMAYQNRGNEALREKARQGAMRYDIQAVVQNNWLPAFRDIEALLKEGQIEVVPIAESEKEMEGVA